MTDEPKVFLTADQFAWVQAEETERTRFGVQAQKDHMDAVLAALDKSIAAQKPEIPLRDWFAGQALAGIIIATSSGDHDPAAKHGVWIVLSIAKDAYEMADAMIEARK